MWILLVYSSLLCFVSSLFNGQRFQLKSSTIFSLPKIFSIRVQNTKFSSKIFRGFNRYYVTSKGSENSMDFFSDFIKLITDSFIAVMSPLDSNIDSARLQTAGRAFRSRGGETKKWSTREKSNWTKDDIINEFESKYLIHKDVKGIKKTVSKSDTRSTLLQMLIDLEDMELLGNVDSHILMNKDKINEERNNLVSHIEKFILEDKVNKKDNLPYSSELNDDMKLFQLKKILMTE